VASGLPVNQSVPPSVADHSAQTANFDGVFCAGGPPPGIDAGILSVTEQLLLQVFASQESVQSPQVWTQFTATFPWQYPLIEPLRSGQGEAQPARMSKSTRVIPTSLSGQSSKHDAPRSTASRAAGGVNSPTIWTDEADGGVPRFARNLT
jgi:hypothetical protein